MPGIELHADFDRDGRLSGSRIERDARARPPGAIVVPNLDRDPVSLSSVVTGARAPASDYARVPPARRDDELVPIEIRVAPGALATGDRLRIRVPGVMHTRMALFDQTGAIVPHRLGHPGDFELPAPAGGRLSLRLQVRTLAGARFGRTSSLATGFRADSRDETHFQLIVLRVDAQGAEIREDSGHFTVAPVILDDRLSRPTRLYVVRKTDNEPSRFDLRRAARAAGVPVVEVDESLSGGDSWMQDQYQHGTIQGPDKLRQVILHLPRLRSDNSIASVTTNLGAVVDSHFRSRDIALHRDLWERVFPVIDSAGTALRLDFRSLKTWLDQVNLLFQVVDVMNRTGEVFPSWAPIPTDDWVETLRQLRACQERLDGVIDAATGTGEGQIDAATASRHKTAIADLVTDLLRRLRVEGTGGSSAVRSRLAGGFVRLPEQTARDLEKRASQVHHSANYGGNLESTPPMSGAPWGKIVVGNTRFTDDSELMDPDLLNLLAKQRKQPIVEIDTSWLKVGHVDEIMAVVPRRRSGFSVLHASSKAGIALLQRAEDRHRAGRGLAPLTTATRRPARSRANHLTDGGSAPVTRLFRGKGWVHNHPRAQPGQTREVILPPRIFLRMAAFYGPRAVRARQTLGAAPQPPIGFQPGVGQRRFYRADMTVTDLLWAETDGNGISCNLRFDDLVLAPSREILARELSRQPLPVPAIFDRVDSVSLLAANHTTALLPAMANMQVLGDHLLVPRPFGPRMRPDDAVTVVREAMQDVSMPSAVRARVSRNLIAAHRLHRPWHVWIEKINSITANTGGANSPIILSFRGLYNEDDVVDTFRDGFPGASDARLRREIVQPNHRHFAQGRVKYGHLRLRMHDGMVDIFELWMAALASELGVHLHFIDSWFYHLHDGQIHCGTNVLRRPTRAGRPNSWDGPDFTFRGRTIDFGPDDGDTISAPS